MKFKLSFCPTGQGGGVDPSCSKSGETGNTRSARLAHEARAAEKTAAAAKASGKAYNANRTRPQDRKGVAAASHATGAAARGDHAKAAAAHETAAQHHDDKANHHEAVARNGVRPEANVSVAKGHQDAAAAHRDAAEHHKGFLHDAVEKGKDYAGKVVGLAKSAVTSATGLARGIVSGSSASHSGGGGGGGGRGGGGLAGKKKKKQIKLSFCATGEGGGKDPSCSPKLGGEAVKRMLLASEASKKANAETNVLRAAKLHAAAGVANAKASKAIEKDPQYSKIVGARQLVQLHDAKNSEHRSEVKKLSDKVFNTNPERAAELQKQQSELRVKAEFASRDAAKIDRAIGNPSAAGQNVRMYAQGQASAETKAVQYARSYGAHNKAADAHEAAGSKDRAEAHRARAADSAKQWEYHRNRMGER